MKALRITPVFLAICLAVAPFTAILAHSISHVFVTEHHEHSEPIHHDHDADHPLVPILIPSFAPAVQNYQAPTELSVTKDFLAQLESINSNELLEFTTFKEDNPRPPIGLPLFLLSHPSNAPPIR